MTEPFETVLCTFTYSHTRGVFTGHLPNGASFDFIAAADSPLPTKLRNALQALMQKAHTAFRTTTRTRGSTDAEWDEVLAQIQAYEQRNGVSVHRTRGSKTRRARQRTSINIDELEME